MQHRAFDSSPGCLNELALAYSPIKWINEAALNQKGETQTKKVCE